MKNKSTIALMMAVFLSVMIQLGSQAQTSTSEEVKWSAPAPGAVTVAHKPTFKDKHPVIYRRFRKVRAVCIFVGPVVNVAANVTTALRLVL